MIDERIADRRREVREQDRRRRLRRTILLAAAIALVITLVVVERSALVGLEEVRVAGTQRLSEQAVREAAALELGTSTLRLGLGAASERVEELPLVRSAAARRIDPLTVEITVVEREPALVAAGAGVQRAIDRDGVVLFDGAVDGLVTVQLRREPPPVGGVSGDVPALDNALVAWRGLSGALRAEVIRYDAPSADDLTLVLRDATRVRIGRADRMDEKVRAIGAVRGDLDGTRVQVIDVRAPSAPVVVGGS